MLTWRMAKRVVVFVVGMTVLLIGIAAIVLPVLQAWLIIPAGLGILATEFVWARKLLKKVKDRARSAFPVISKKPKSQTASADTKAEQACSNALSEDSEPPSDPCRPGA